MHRAHLIAADLQELSQPLQIVAERNVVVVLEHPAQRIERSMHRPQHVGIERMRDLVHDGGSQHIVRPLNFVFSLHDSLTYFYTL